MKKTYLLGAGFSKAFHQSMPLMNELAGEVLLELGLDAEVLSPFRDDLEAWLSYLATRQPWEDDVTAAQNEATFLQASAAIATCITRASGRPAPHGDRGQQQLHRLVLDWRIHSSPVLTFNYDLLVERVVEEWDPSVTGSDLYPVPLVERDAVGAAARTGYAEARQPSFELYKLHGSINWFHSPSNSTGPITVPTGRPTATTSEGQRQRYLYSDLRPLVVPPTTTKSAFYGGDAMRALWRNASEALKTTDQLVVIGYSASSRRLTCRCSRCSAKLSRAVRGS